MPVFITLDKMAKKTANYLEKIYEASLKFLVPLSPEETYRTIVQEAMKLVGGESGVIVLEKNGKLQRVYKESPKGFPSLRMRKEGYTQKAFREQKALVVHSNELSKVRPKLTAAGVKSNAYIPLAY
ncbi:MAG: GAF domain-containing protein, partial [Candidatus Daviesbacteria bacterium]|nr:GAF domain-containing protein [Candidatus Daviesbacteria bacterium]